MSLQSETTENVSTESRPTAEMFTEDGSRCETDGNCDPTETSEITADCQKPLSKNQIKKQKKKERWLHFKAEKRQAEKQKRKKRLAEMRERGEDIGPSRKSLKKKKMVDSACRQRVAIDCSFDDYMTEKDTTFLVQQIQHSYAANRRAENPLQLYICGIGGKAKQRLDSIGDYRGWDIHKEEQNFTELFPKEEVVYLSSESPNVLQSLDVNKVYIIGGLVDHNHHKGLCHSLAEQRGLSHAQLPIGQFLQLKSRKVLTINHVLEILLRFTETKDWQTSFLAVLPQRKGVTPHIKTDPGQSEDGDSHSSKQLEASHIKTDPGQSGDSNSSQHERECIERVEEEQGEREEERASVITENRPLELSCSSRDGGSDGGCDGDGGREISASDNRGDTTTTATAADVTRPDGHDNDMHVSASEDAVNTTPASLDVH